MEKENPFKLTLLVRHVMISISKIGIMIQSVLQVGNKGVQEDRKYWQMVNVKLVQRRWREIQTTLVEAAEFQFVEASLEFLPSLNVLNVLIILFKIQRTHQNACEKNAQLNKLAMKMESVKSVKIILWQKIMHVYSCNANLMNIFFQQDCANNVLLSRSMIKLESIVFL